MKKKKRNSCTLPQPEKRKKVLDPKSHSPTSETKKLVLTDTKEIPGKSKISHTHVQVWNSYIPTELVNKMSSEKVKEKET